MLGSVPRWPCGCIQRPYLLLRSLAHLSTSSCSSFSSSRDARYARPTYSPRKPRENRPVISRPPFSPVSLTSCFYRSGFNSRPVFIVSVALITSWEANEPRHSPGSGIDWFRRCLRVTWFPRTATGVHESWKSRDKWTPRSTIVERFVRGNARSDGYFCILSEREFSTGLFCELGLDYWWCTAARGLGNVSEVGQGNISIYVDQQTFFLSVKVTRLEIALLPWTWYWT